MQSLPTIASGGALQGVRGVRGKLVDNDRSAKAEKVEKLHGLYDFAEPGETRDKLKAKVLSSKGNSPRPHKPKHPALEEVADWMRAERKRAEERAERRWRTRFQEWQRDAQISKPGLKFQDWEIGGAGSPTPPQVTTPSRSMSRHSSLPELIDSRMKRSLSSGSLGSVSGPSHRGASKQPPEPIVEMVSLDSARRRTEKEVAAAVEATQAAADAKISVAEAEVARLKERLQAAERECGKQAEDIRQQAEDIRRQAEDIRRQAEDIRRQREENQRVLDDLHLEREYRSSAERRLAEVAAERDSWRESAGRRESRLRQALQEKSDTSERLADIGRFMSNLQARNLGDAKGAPPVRTMILKSRVRPQPTDEQRKAAAITIQSVGRGIQTRMKVQALRQQRQAALERQRREAAALKIQSVSRGRRARRSVLERRQALIQEQVNNTLKQDYASLAELQDRAALKIQSVHRGRQARWQTRPKLHVRPLNAEDESTVEVAMQGLPKRFQDRRARRQGRRIRSSPALVSGENGEEYTELRQMPATTRAVASRSASYYRDKEAAIVRIQSYQRGRLARRQVASRRAARSEEVRIQRSRSWASNSKDFQRSGRSLSNLVDDADEGDESDKEADDTTALHPADMEVIRVRTRHAFEQAGLDGSLHEMLGNVRRQIQQQQSQQVQREALVSFSEEETTREDTQNGDLVQARRTDKRKGTGYVKLGQLPPEDEDEEDEDEEGEDKSHKVRFDKEDAGEEDESQAEAEPQARRKDRRIPTGFVDRSKLPIDEEDDDEETKQKRHVQLPQDGGEDEAAPKAKRKERRQPTGFIDRSKLPVDEDEDEEDEDETRHVKLPPEEDQEGEDEAAPKIHRKDRRVPTGFVDRSKLPVDDDEDEDEEGEHHVQFSEEDQEGEDEAAPQMKRKDRRTPTGFVDRSKLPVDEDDDDEDEEESGIKRGVSFDPSAADSEAAPEMKRKDRRIPTGFVDRSKLPIDEEEDDEGDDHHVQFSPEDQESQAEAAPEVKRKDRRVPTGFVDRSKLPVDDDEEEDEDDGPHVQFSPEEEDEESQATLRPKRKEHRKPTGHISLAQLPPEEDEEEEEENEEEAESGAEVQVRARASLLQAARDGSLAQVMAKRHKSESRPVELQEAETTEKDTTETVEIRARASLIQATRDGALARILAEKLEGDAHSKEPQEEQEKLRPDAAVQELQEQEEGSVDVKLRARSSLLQATRDGSLAGILNNKLHPTQKEIETEESKTERQMRARASLVEAIQDGSLADILKNDDEKEKRKTELQVRARASLVQAARDGSLAESLNRQLRPAEKEAESEESKTEHKMRARASLVQATRDGSLAQILAEKLNHSDSTESETKADASSDTQAQARANLIQAARDGVLSRLVDARIGASHMQREDMGDEKETEKHVDESDAASQARASLVSALQDGHLSEILAAKGLGAISTPVLENEAVEKEEEARDAILTEMKAGGLGDALAKVGKAAAEHDAEVQAEAVATVSGVVADAVEHVPAASPAASTPVRPSTVEEVDFAASSPLRPSTVEEAAGQPKQQP